MLRSGSVPASPVLEIGELSIDRAASVASVRGATLPLGAKVIATLLVLHDHAGRVVPKATLIASVWGDVPIDESSIWRNVHVLRGVLKRYAPGARIETVKGRGYRLIVDEPVAAKVPASTDSEPPVHERLPGWVWSLGGAAAAALVFGAVHVAQPVPHERRVLVLVGKPSDRLPPLPPLPGNGERTQIVFAPIVRK